MTERRPTVKGKKGRDTQQSSTPELPFCLPVLPSYLLTFLVLRLISSSSPGTRHSFPIYTATAAGVGTMALDISDEVIAGEPGAISSGLRSFTQLINGIH